MSTNWMPIVGRGCTLDSPGRPPRSPSSRLSERSGFLLILRVLIGRDALTGRHLAQPSCAPTSSSYFCDEAQEMNFQALSCLLLFFNRPRQV